MNENQKYLKKQTTIDARLLHKLMDGEIHTRQELANKFEVSTKTIQRSIERLNMFFIIHTFRGGIKKGGIYLDEIHIYYELKKKAI